MIIHIWFSCMSLADPTIWSILLVKTNNKTKTISMTTEDLTHMIIIIQKMTVCLATNFICGRWCFFYPDLITDLLWGQVDDGALSVFGRGWALNRGWGWRWGFRRGRWWSGRGFCALLCGSAGYRGWRPPLSQERSPAYANTHTELTLIKKWETHT